jgi:hypothetical protein
VIHLHFRQGFSGNCTRTIFPPESLAALSASVFLCRAIGKNCTGNGFPNDSLRPRCSVPPSEGQWPKYREPSITFIRSMADEHFDSGAVHSALLTGMYRTVSFLKIKEGERQKHRRRRRSFFELLREKGIITRERLTGEIIVYLNRYSSVLGHGADTIFQLAIHG